MPVPQKTQSSHKTLDLSALYARFVRSGKMEDPAPDVENETTASDGSDKLPTPPFGLWQGAFGMIQGNGRGPRRTTA